MKFGENIMYSLLKTMVNAKFTSKWSEQSEYQMYFLKF